MEPAILHLGPQRLTLLWSIRASVRLGALPRGPRLEDIRPPAHESRGDYFLVAYVWAMLHDPAQRAQYPFYEDVADLFDAATPEQKERAWDIVLSQGYGEPPAPADTAEGGGSTDPGETPAKLSPSPAPSLA